MTMMKSGCVYTDSRFSCTVEKRRKPLNGEAAAAVCPAVLEGTTSMSSSFSVVATEAAMNVELYQEHQWNRAKRAGHGGASQTRG